MDLLRGHRKRGRRLDLIPVEVIAALHVHETDAVAGGGKIVRLQIVAQSRQRRIDFLCDRGAMRLRQPLALCGPNRLGLLYRPEIGESSGFIFS